MAILVENKDYELRQNSQNNDLYELFSKGANTGLKLKLKEGKDKYKNITFQGDITKNFQQKEMILEPLSTDTIIDINLDSYVSIETKDNILLVKDEFRIGKAYDVYMFFFNETKSYDNGYDNIMIEKLSVNNSKDVTLYFGNVVKNLNIESVNNNGVSKRGHIYFKQGSIRDIQEINLTNITTMCDYRDRPLTSLEFTVFDSFVANNVLFIGNNVEGACGFSKDDEDVGAGADSMEFRNVKISLDNLNTIAARSMKIIGSKDNNQSLYKWNEPLDFEQRDIGCYIKCKEFKCIDQKVDIRYSSISAPGSIVTVGEEGSTNEVTLNNASISSKAKKDIHIQNLMLTDTEIEYTKDYKQDEIKLKNITTNGGFFTDVAFLGDNVDIESKKNLKMVSMENVVFKPLSNVKINHMENFACTLNNIVFDNVQFEGNCILNTSGIPNEIKKTNFSNTETTIKLNDNAFTSLQNIDYELYHSGSRAIDWEKNAAYRESLTEKLRSFSFSISDSTFKGKNTFIAQEKNIKIEKSNIENCQLSNIKRVEESNIVNFSSDENSLIDYVKKNEKEPVQEKNITQSKVKETSEKENQKQGRVMKKTEKGFLYQYDSGLIGKVSDLDKLDGYKMFLSVVADANGKSNVFNNFRISGKIDTLKLQSTVEEYIKSTSDLSEIVDKTIKSTILQGMQDNLVLNRHVYEPYLKRLNDTFAEVVNNSNIKDEQIKKDALTGFLYAGSKYANSELDNLRAEYAKINITEGSNNGLNFNNALTFQDSNFLSTAAFTTAEGTRVTRATLEIKDVDFDGNFKAHFSCVTPNGAPKYIPVSGNLDDLMEGKLKFDLTGKEKIKDIKGIAEAYNNSLAKNFSYIKKHLDIPGLDTEDQLNTAVQTEADAIRKYGKREPSAEELAEIRQTKLDEINAGLQPKIDIFLDTLPAQLKKGMSVNVGRQVGGEIATRFGFQGWNGFVNSMLDMLPSVEEIKPLATKVVAMAESLEKEKALEVKPEVKEKSAEIER